MSIEAFEWALRHAPKHATDSVRLVLFGLANHAWKDGTNAYPSQGTLASYLAGGDNPANRRKVKRALRELESGGWITRGWNESVARFPKAFRPVVWNLNLALIDEGGDTSDTTLGTPVTPPWGHSQSEVGTPTVKGGDTSVPQTVINHPQSLGEPGLSPFDPNLDRTDPRRLTTEIPGFRHLNDLTDSDLTDRTKQKCHQHIGQGYVKDNCGACGHVKDLFRQEAEYRQAKQHQDDQRRRQGIDHCTDCDEFGWLKSAKLERGEFTRCQHTQEDAA